MLLSATTYKSVDQIRDGLPQACEIQGFDLLGEYDLQARLQERGRAHGRRCLVIDLYDAARADKVLAEHVEVCAMLPYRIAVYPHDDGKTRLSAVRPTQLLGRLGNADLVEIAQDAERRLAALLVSVAQ